MALLHHATLTPTKRELLDPWLARQPWFDGIPERGPVGSFRFDDPDGQVGIEGFLLGSAGSTLFVPLTFRGAELPGAEEFLIGTSEHSVLGTRWVYDGCGDPVCVDAFVQAIITGGTGAVEEFEVDGERVAHQSAVSVRGSGSATDLPSAGKVGTHDEGGVTVVNAGPLEVVVVRVVGTETPLAETLTATWAGGTDVVLAGVRPG